MKKQTPPSQQDNQLKSNTKISPVPIKGSPSLTKLDQPSAKQIQPVSGNAIAVVARRNSMIRRLSQRKRTNILDENNNRPNWKCLSTGLEMLFSPEQINKIWTFDKPKMIIQELLHDLLKRLEAQKNFESMELNIIAEFHLYNLIFAKQKLFLDYDKAAIFINLMWTLLINDNNDYKNLHTNYTKATIQTFDELNRKNSLQQINGKVPTQPATNSQQRVSSLQNISESLKSINRDLENFKKWIVKHSSHNPPNSLKIFDAQQVQMIVEFAQNSYFSNFSLYNYCLNNKKKNEEIEIQLFIDKPLIIPPLSDALYMGQPKIEIPDDEDDELAAKNRQKEKKGSFNIGQKQKIPSLQQISGKGSLISDNSADKVDSDTQRQIEQGQEGQEDEYNSEEGEHENEEDDDGLKKYSSQSRRGEKKQNSEEQQIRNIVNTKLKSVEEQFSQTIQKRQEEINRQYEEIVNPKKKK